MQVAGDRERKLEKLSKEGEQIALVWKRAARLRVEWCGPAFHEGQAWRVGRAL
jgi:hypothetical protein